MVASKTTTLHAAERLGHAEACRLAALVTRSVVQTFVIDLSATRDASTAGFARLVLLRREMLQAGRDLRLSGLRYRARQLFEVHRLATVLPAMTEAESADRFFGIPCRPVMPRLSHRKHAVA